MKSQQKLLMLLMLYAISLNLHAQTINRTFPVTDGPVYASDRKGDTLYIGGYFSHVGYQTKGLAHFIKDSVRADADFPQLDGVVNDVISDDAGGYFVGGNSFFYFNGYDISNNKTNNIILIHIKADKTLDSNFTVKDNLGQGSVTSLKKVNNKLYLGGNFTNINNIRRPYLAELNATTGSLDNWIPSINPGTDVVKKVEATDSVIFVTGEFSTSQNGYSSEYMRSFSAATGAIVKGFPTLTSEDDLNASFKINGSKLYVGTKGTNAGFNAFGVGRFDTATGKQIPDFPVTNGIIYALASDGAGGYYMGGNFDMVGDISRSYLAHVLTDGSIDTAFNLSLNNEVNCFTTDGVNLYIGGHFSRINDSVRNYAAAISLASQKLTQWNPGPNGDVLAMAYSSGIVYMGGRFNKVGKTIRSRAASVTVAGALTAWNPNLNGDVFCITPNQTGTFLYIGGYYSTVNKKARNNICKVDNNTGLIATWNPNVSSAVEGIALDGSTVYFGGYFYYVGAYTRNYLAGVDTLKGTPTSFNPNPDDYVSSVAVYGGKLYAGGDFTKVGTINQNFAAKFDLKTKKLDNWNPYIVDNFPGSYGGNINAIVTAGYSVVLGGEFTAANAVTINHVFCFDTHTGAFGTFFPKIDSLYGDVNAMDFAGNEVFAGGTLSVLKNDHTWKYGVYSFDTATGIVKRVYEQFENGDPVTALKAKDNHLYIGGQFTQLITKDNSATIPRLNMCSYDLTADTLESTTYDPNKKVTSLICDSAGIIASGGFTISNSLFRENIAAIDLNKNKITDFKPTARSGYVTSVALKDSLLYVGGGFSEINEIPRSHLAAVNIANSQTADWQCDINNYVDRIVLKDSTLYVTGGFTNVQGVARNYIAAVTTDNATVLPWNPNPDSYVYAVAFGNNKVYLGGAFNNCAGQPRKYLAEVDNQIGNIASLWNPLPNGSISALLTDNNFLYAGGDFQYLNGKYINAVCRFNLFNDSLDMTFHPSIGWGAWVNNLAEYNDNLFVGGNIIDKNNFKLSNLSAINTNTSAFTPFQPSPDYSDLFPNSNVNAVNVYGNLLVAGGSWNNLVNYAPNSNLAVFSLDSLKPTPVLVFNNIQSTSATAGFYNLGQGDKLVIISRDSILTLPSNGKIYSANSVYGLGDTIGLKSYVVYNGTDSSVNITGLVPNHQYYLSVINYGENESGIIYQNTSPLSGSFITTCNTGTIEIDSSGSLSLCPGKTVSLWAAAGYNNYTWNNGTSTDTINVSIPEYYSVTATDSNNCFVDNGVTVTQIPCADPAGLSVSNITKSSAQVTWNAMPCAVAYQLQWRKKGTTTWSKAQISTPGKKLTGLSSGTTYQWRVATYCETSPVIIISAYTNGSEFTTAASFAFSASSDYNDATVTDHLSAILSPNPAINTSTLILNNLKGTAGIIITDISGKVLWEKDKVSDLNISLPVEKLSEGMYFVRIQDNNDTIILKLVKTN